MGGYLDVEDVHYQGYNDAISFGQHSLFALQTDVELTETLSFTTQLLAHTSAARDSGLEWAYLSWRPSSNWHFKAGKLRTPLYLHSDTIDVGFSYPWILPPLPVYTPYQPIDFTGLSAAYQFNIRDWSIETKAYWGRFEGAITVLDEFPLGVKADKLKGLILALNRGNLRLRATYNRTAGEIKGVATCPPCRDAPPAWLQQKRGQPEHQNQVRFHAGGRQLRYAGLFSQGRMDAREQQPRVWRHFL